MDGWMDGWSPFEPRASLEAAIGPAFLSIFTGLRHACCACPASQMVSHPVAQEVCLCNPAMDGRTLAP